MSNDLISREAVLKILYDIKDNPDTPKNYGTILDIIREVRNLQTAYNVDSVCDEMNRVGKRYCNSVKCECECENCDHFVMMNTLTNIVRNGGRKRMIELEKLGKIMDIIISNCDECPLEKVCNHGRCGKVWEEFFNKKIKEDGLIVED